MIILLSTTRNISVKPLNSNVFRYLGALVEKKAICLMKYVSQVIKIMIDLAACFHITSVPTQPGSVGMAFSAVSDLLCPSSLTRLPLTQGSPWPHSLTLTLTLTVTLTLTLTLTCCLRALHPCQRRAALHSLSAPGFLPMGSRQNLLLDNSRSRKEN